MHRAQLSLHPRVQSVSASVSGALGCSCWDPPQAGPGVGGGESSLVGVQTALGERGRISPHREMSRSSHRAGTRQRPRAWEGTAPPGTLGPCQTMRWSTGPQAAPGGVLGCPAAGFGCGPASDRGPTLYLLCVIIKLQKLGHVRSIKCSMSCLCPSGRLQSNDTLHHHLLPGHSALQ